MWQVYFSIAVVFGAAYCIPVKRSTDMSQCAVVITRFGEPVTALEVKWHSTIRLICDASCVGPGPQPGLTWFYKNKTSKTAINIEKLFQSPKFETYPTRSHRKNELIIRDFGPSEEARFICRGYTKNKGLKAVVWLNGTDCLLKYNFRCQSDKSCIDRGKLCNGNNECPDGEDEVDCEKPCEYRCGDGTCIASTKQCDGYPDCPDSSDEICGGLGLTCPVGKRACKDSSNCIEDSQRCNQVQDCPDGGDEVGCDYGDDTDITTAGSSKIMQETTVEIKRTSEEGDDTDITTAGSSKIMQETTVEIKRTSEEGDDTDITTAGSSKIMQETTVEIKRTSEEGDDTDITTAGSSKIMQETTVEIKRTSEEGRPCEYRCGDGTCIASSMQCNGYPDCPDSSDEICGGFGLICSEGKRACNDSSNCIEDSQRCNRVQDCQDGSDEVGCDFGKDGNLKNRLLSKSDDRYRDTELPATKTPQEEEDDDYYYDYAKEGKEDTKTLTRGTEINVDANTNRIPATDAVTAKTGEFTRTTPFDYLFYIDYFQQSDQS